MKLDMIGRIEVIVISTFGDEVDHFFWGLVLIVEENSDHLVIVDKLLLASYVGVILVCTNDVFLNSLPPARHKFESLELFSLIKHQVFEFFSLFTINYNPFHSWLRSSDIASTWLCFTYFCWYPTRWWRIGALLAYWSSARLRVTCSIIFLSNSWSTSAVGFTFFGIIRLLNGWEASQKWCFLARRWISWALLCFCAHRTCQECSIHRLSPISLGLFQESPWLSCRYGFYRPKLWLLSRSLSFNDP